MGIILSRVRKKKSAVETLEKLENEIKEIEENRSSAQRRYKKITKLFLIYSFVLYVFCGIFFYFQYKSSLKGKLLYLVPLAISPLLLYLVKRIISWYYIRLINKNQIRLNEMKKEKKKILDEVMDKETYKVAKEILEKYSTDNIKINQNMQLATIKQPEEGLRKRLVNVSNMPKPLSNIGRSYSLTQPPKPQLPPIGSSRALQYPGASMMRLPAPILPLQRGYMDRVVEYLIGDGVNNRYALICSNCHSHNGMALKEEFEYIGFKCCYCFSYNPARKVRPEAPKLESSLKDKHESDSDSESKTSTENSEEEIKALLGSEKDAGESLETLQPSVLNEQDKSSDFDPKNISGDILPDTKDKESNSFAESKTVLNEKKELIESC